LIQRKIILCRCAYYKGSPVQLLLKKLWPLDLTLKLWLRISTVWGCIMSCLVVPYFFCNGWRYSNEILCMAFSWIVTDQIWVLLRLTYFWTELCPVMNCKSKTSGLFSALDDEIYSISICAFAFDSHRSSLSLLMLDLLLTKWLTKSVYCTFLHIGLRYSTEIFRLAMDSCRLKFTVFLHLNYFWLNYHHDIILHCDLLNEVILHCDIICISCTEVFFLTISYLVSEDNIYFREP
jgi:hypothetical protein